MANCFTHITYDAVHAWLMDCGQGPDEAMEDTDIIIRDLTGHKPTKTARARVYAVLRRMWREAWGDQKAPPLPDPRLPAC